MILDDDQDEKRFELSYRNYLRIDKKIKIAEAQIREKAGTYAAKREGLYRIRKKTILFGYLNFESFFCRCFRY